jgi:hypothetical protein
MAEQVSAKLAVASASGTGNKGLYVEAMDPTNFKCNWLEIVLLPDGTIGGGKCNVDVAVGADMSEVDKIIEFPFQHSANSSGDNQSSYQKISMPFEFAAGVRLSVRCCDASGSAVGYLIQIRIISY